jgi:hypothetical protein
MPFLSPRLLSLALPGLLALAGAACSTTPQERAAQKQAEAQNMMTVYGPACSRLGYALNSDAWRNCIVSLSTKDDLQRYGPGPGYYPGWGPYWHGGGYWGPYW